MSPNHVLLSCKANWSHLRSLCILAARIASSRAITITILVANVEGAVERVTQEVARSMNEETVADEVDIRIVGLPMDTTNNAVLDDAFRLTWKALMSHKAIQCAHKSTQVAAVSKPSLVILDGFQLSWLEIIRSVPSPPPIFQWMMAFSGGFMYMCGPADQGGRAGQPASHYGHDCNDLIRIPGMPPMTCRELNPQDLEDKAIKIQIAEATMVRFLEKADGLLTACAPEYDSQECLDSISNWVARRNKRMTFHIGPMVPLIPGTQRFSTKAVEAEATNVPGGCGGAALDFLDRSMRSHGQRSVFYISFGTEHWPSSLEHIQILLTVLKKRGYPFIFSHAHPNAKIPKNMMIEFETLGPGIFLPFAPQQAILAHKACGWFITHGGANGTMEALSQGIPLIGWPFAVDQPLNVAYMARTLDVGFELTAMRTGSCPLANSDFSEPPNNLTQYEVELEYVLDAAREKIGQRKRENAERIGGNLALAWSKSGGRARQELSRLLDYYRI